MKRTRRPKRQRLTTQFWIRLFIAVGLVVSIGLIVATHKLLTRRFAETQRTDSQLTAALYSGNMISILERQSLVPLLLARDPLFITALQSADYTNTSQRLIDFSREINSAGILLLDVSGRVVAASDRRELGTNLSDKPYVVNAMRETGTIFTVNGLEEGQGQFTFQYSRKVTSGQQTIGVVVVRLDLSRLEESWRRRNDIVVVTNSADQVILASNPFWRRNTLTDVLSSAPSPSGVQRAFQPPRDTAEGNPYVFLNNQLLMRTEIKTTFRGWRLTYFASFEEVSARVNAIIALEIMGLSLSMALGLYLVNNRLQRQSARIAAESEQLRRLNARLSEEIEERRKVEQNLKVAEQSLEQASKLAALGEMSAAVSHELNQPLAAMRTYLAGARLLLKRARPDEALASFHRIDDLIERMGAITRQLKSFARRGTSTPVPVDIRDAVDGSLAMMTPQLRDSRIEIRKILPPQPALVLADPVRLDQIIVNLLRNAVDAVDGEPEPVIEILVVQGQQVSLSVRDNGSGIADPEALFEPFYTTKKPGEGVGLGLAISAGIANGLGGRLTARNADPKGAIFELQLPRARTAAQQAAE